MTQVGQSLASDQAQFMGADHRFESAVHVEPRRDAANVVPLEPGYSGTRTAPGRVMAQITQMLSAITSSDHHG